MIPEPDIEKITKEHILALMDKPVEEGRTLDYKLALPGNSPSDKVHFLADVCAFANTNGGDLIYGVEEQNGRPVAIPGIAHLNPDQEKLRLEGIIQRGITPTVRVEFRAVTDLPQGPVFVVRVPRSWTGPHMVSVDGLSRFYSRGNAGNLQMNYEQIRSSFGSAEDLRVQIKKWREGRIEAILQGDTPIPLPHASKLILHIVPLGSFSAEDRYEVSDLRRVCYFHPIATGSDNHRMNLDGIVTHRELHERVTMMCYCQVWRSARIEAAVSTAVFEANNLPFFPIVEFEKYIIEAVRDYMKAYRELEVPPPAVLGLSVCGVKGIGLASSVSLMINVDTKPCDRDQLILREIVIQDWGSDPTQLLRPVFDSLWNVFNVGRSPLYGRDGTWTPCLSSPWVRG